MEQILSFVLVWQYERLAFVWEYCNSIRILKFSMRISILRNILFLSRLCICINMNENIYLSFGKLHNFPKKLQSYQKTNNKNMNSMFDTCNRNGNQQCWWILHIHVVTAPLVKSKVSCFVVCNIRYTHIIWMYIYYYVCCSLVYVSHSFEECSKSISSEESYKI